MEKCPLCGMYKSCRCTKEELKARIRVVTGYCDKETKRANALEAQLAEAVTDVTVE